MRTILLCFLLVFFFNIQQAFAQKNGTYMNASGYSCVITKLSDNKIKVEAGGRSDEYVRQSGNVFVCQSPDNSQYRLRVSSDTKVYSYRTDKDWPEVLFEFQHSNEITKDISKCELAEKYLKKMTTDADNAQVWAFCSQAAVIVCSTEPGTGRDNQLSTIVTIIKSFASTANSPCLDVIPNSVWTKK